MTVSTKKSRARQRGPERRYAIDSIPLETIRKFAALTERFVTAYASGKLVLERYIGQQNSSEVIVKHQLTFHITRLLQGMYTYKIICSMAEISTYRLYKEYKTYKHRPRTP
ncbi:hypothetical protein RSAG8_11687, partial [Rhizoctonia solani AG-8 WAC10335]